MSAEILLGDCLELLKAMPDNSVASVPCDPPYHLTSIVKRFSKVAVDDDNATARRLNGRTDSLARLARGFMGQTWDGGDVAFRPETWAEVLRVLKPGGFVAAFGATRNYHRMACAIEDAGFEVRDMGAWAYGSGFPKSLNVSKAIDRAAGREREVVGFDASRARPNRVGKVMGDKEYDRSDNGATITSPATDEAREWDGWGTALKPAWEPICLARKPLSERTVAANVLKWGTGALNIDGCRIDGRSGADVGKGSSHIAFAQRPEGARFTSHTQGRWPANLCHDGSDEVIGEFPDSENGRFPGSQTSGWISHSDGTGVAAQLNLSDSGSAARFFYCAKAGKLDRLGSDHPTVKPVALMRWLVRLITPPGGLVLDPFAGTGSTGIAAFVEGFPFVMCELREEAVADITRRLAHIRGLGRTTALEMAQLDVAGHAKARGDDLPLFGPVAV